jgi:hypothetical protein
MHACRRFGAAKDGCHLRRWPILVVVEDDCRSLRARELANGAIDVEPARSIGRLWQKPAANELPEAISAQGTKRQPDRHPTNPGVGALVRRDLRPMDEQLDERVLGQLFGSPVIPQHELDRSQDRGELPPEERRVLEGSIGHEDERPSGRRGYGRARLCTVRITTQRVRCLASSSVASAKVDCQDSPHPAWGRPRLRPPCRSQRRAGEDVYRRVDARRG